MGDLARREPGRRQPQARRGSAGGQSASVLALQQVLGNRALGQVLAREPAPADTTAPAETTTIDLGDLGVIPVSSYSQSPSRGAAAKEIHLVSPVGPHSAQLADAVAKGKQIPSAVLVIKGQSITFTGVYISSYQSSTGGNEPLDSWSLSFDGVQYEHQ